MYSFEYCEYHVWFVGVFAQFVGFIDNDFGNVYIVVWLGFVPSMLSLYGISELVSLACRWIC